MRRADTDQSLQPNSPLKVLLFFGWPRYICRNVREWTKGLTKYGFDKFAFETLKRTEPRSAGSERNQLDAVPRESEWHIVFEPYAAESLCLVFGWLICKRYRHLKVVVSLK